MLYVHGVAIVASSAFLSISAIIAKRNKIKSCGLCINLCTAIDLLSLMNFVRRHFVFLLLQLIKEHLCGTTEFPVKG